MAMKEMRKNNNIALLFVAIILVQIYISFFVAIPSHFTIDGFIYHLMAMNFAENFSLSVQNGYEIIQTPALNLMFTVENGDKIYPKFPSLYAIVAYPFYKLFALKGLILLNSLSFVGVLYFTYKISEKFFSKETSIFSLIILTFGTFIWQYSQAVWPHMAALFFIIFSIHLFLDAEDKNKKGIYFVSGLIFGVAVGLRYDSIFAATIFFVPFLFSNGRISNVALVFLGTIPALLFLSITNHIKFGTWLPFSYGHYKDWDRTSFSFRYFAIIASAAVIFLIIFCKKFFEKEKTKKIYGISVWIALLSGSMIFWQIYPEILKKFINGFYAILVDLRTLALYVHKFAGPVSETGAIIYESGYKKAFLQNVPIAVLLLGCLFKYKDSRNIKFLLTVPLTYMVIFGGMAWHGGLSYDTRYLIPALPFIAILISYIFFDIVGETSRNNYLISIIVAIIIAYFLWSNFYEESEFVFYDFPLYLAAILAISAALTFATKKLKHIFMAMIFVCLLWGGGVSIFYDYKKLDNIRQANLDSADIISDNIEDNSILLVCNFMQRVFLVKADKKDLIVSCPIVYDYDGAKRLLSYAVEKKKNIYTYLETEEHNILKDRFFDYIEDVRAFIPPENGKLIKVKRVL